MPAPCAKPAHHIVARLNAAAAACGLADIPALAHAAGIDGSDVYSLTLGTCSSRRVQRKIELHTGQPIWTAEADFKKLQRAAFVLGLDPILDPLPRVQFRAVELGLVERRQGPPSMSIILARAERLTGAEADALARTAARLNQRNAAAR